MIALIAMKLMETGLGPRVAKLASWAIVALLAVSLLLIGKCTYDANVIEKHSAKVVAADAKADAQAAATAEKTKGTIDAANERAKAAADSSDDPLAAAFDSLWSETSSRDKTAR